MNKHTAIDPNGKVHTRNSKGRTYSHCVVARIDPIADTHRTLWSAEHNGETNYAYYCGQGRHSINPYTNYRGEPCTTFVAGKDYNSPEEFQADFPTRQDYIDYLVNEAKAKLAARPAGYYDDYGSLGWCGRLDLATKLAAKEAGHKIYRGITILEAEVKS